MLCGLTYEDVWVNLKPIQVKEYLEGYRERIKIERQNQYNLCWLNALYTHISLHNGKAFPQQPEQIYTEKSKQTEQTEAEQEIMIDFILQKINTKQ